MAGTTCCNIKNPHFVTRRMHAFHTSLTMNTRNSINYGSCFNTDSVFREVQTEYLRILYMDFNVERIDPF